MNTLDCNVAHRPLEIYMDCGNLNAFTHTSMHVYTCTCMSIQCTCILFIHGCTCTYIYMYIIIYIHSHLSLSHTHTHTHTHTPMQTEVWVFMELMATCLDRLLKKVGGPFPERIVCKMTVSVSGVMCRVACTCTCTCSMYFPCFPADTCAHV